MKILGLSSSPRRGGNTEILIDQLLRGAEESGAQFEKIHIDCLNIGPCIHCDHCLTHGQCNISDDMEHLYTKLQDTDCLVFASPVYFMGLCAQAKLVVDRCQAFWARRYLLKQPIVYARQDPSQKRLGVLIAVGATHTPGLFDGVQQTIKWFFNALDIEYYGDLLFAGCDAAGAIREHPTALREAYQMGCRLA